MKQSDKITAAEEFLATVKQKFPKAFLIYHDKDTDIIYDDINESLDDHEVDDEVTVAIELVLDEDLTFTVTGDDEDEDHREIAYIN